MTTSIPSQFAKVIDRDQVVQLLANPVTSLLLAYRKDIVDKYHSKYSNTPRLDQWENTRICEALLKPRLLRRTTRWSCHDLDACFKRYRLRLKRAILPDSAPQPGGIRIKTTSLSSAWTNAC